MNNSIIRLLFFVFCFVMVGGLFAQSANPSEAPWDTLLAELQIINEMREPDSVKAALTQDLFSEYDLSAEDYRKFFNELLKKPPEQQVEFLNRIEEIILEMVKEQGEQMRKEYQKRPPR